MSDEKHQDKKQQENAGDGESPDTQPAWGHNFFAQLRERKVVRVTLAYIVAAWALMQVAELIVSALDYPDWITRSIVVALFVGAPFAAVGAWLFEVTPKGVKRDRRDLSKIPRLRRGQRAVDLLVITLLIVVAGVIGYTSIPPLLEEGTTRSADIGSSRAMGFDLNSIAVLAFDNLSPDPDMAYFGDGLAEEILHMLSKLKEFKVSARAASFYFKGKDVPIGEIANSLRVKYLLAGSVRRAGQQIRVSTQLVDATTGYEVWSNTFDRPFEDVFEVQREIALAVAQESQIALSPESRSRLDVTPTDNLDAYDYYLQGREYLRRPRSVDILENAKEVFRRALDLDSNYALAMAGLCEAELGTYQLTKSTEHVAIARESCASALASEAEPADVHAALGELSRQTGDLSAATVSFEKALSIQPDLVEAMEGLARTYLEENRTDDALDLMQRMIDLQPGYWRGYSLLGSYYYRQGQDADAIPYFRRVTDLTPDNALGWNSLGAAQYMTGDLEGAAAAWRRALDISPSQHMYTNLGTMYYYLDRFEEAVDMHERALEFAPDDFRVWGRLAAAHGQQSGNDEEATSAYTKATELAEAVLAVNPQNTDALKNISLFQAHTGKADEARANAERSLELTPNDPDTHFFAALVFCAVEDTNRCFDELGKAVQLGYPKVFIDAEPALDAYRDDPGFLALLVDDDGA